MADTPRIEKYTAAGTFVDLPGFLVRAPSFQQETDFVRYSGDVLPRTYIGEGVVALWSVTGVFNAHIPADLTALGDLVDILDEVHASSDRRLRLTVGGTLETLYPVKVVCALNSTGYPINQAPKGSNIFDVAMNLREVVG